MKAHTTAQAELNDEQIDRQLDAILRAAGSALRYYEMQKTKDDMRDALRNAVLSLAPAAAPQEGKKDIAEDLDFVPDEFHQVADMANVGYSLMKEIEQHRPNYHWNESPGEIVGDLLNEIEELKSSPQSLPTGEAEPFAWITKAALKHWLEKGKAEGVHQYTFLATPGPLQEPSPLRVGLHLSTPPCTSNAQGASEMLDERIIKTVHEIVEREGFDMQGEQQARLLEVVAIETVRALLRSAPAEDADKTGKQPWTLNVGM